MNDTESIRPALIAMRDYGGSFAQRLADAWMSADAINSHRLAQAFPDLLAQYRAMAGPDSPQPPSAA